MRPALLPGFQPGPALRLHLAVRTRRREVVLTGRRGCSSLTTEPFEQFVFLASVSGAPRQSGATPRRTARDGKPDGFSIAGLSRPRPVRLVLKGCRTLWPLLARWWCDGCGELWSHRGQPYDLCCQ